MLCGNCSRGQRKKNGRGQAQAVFGALRKNPIIERTAAVFGGCSAVDEIIIVSGKSGIDECRTLLSFLNKPVKYVLGGSERYESVYNGLSALDECCQIVIVHDGVRPFVTEDIISSSVTAAENTGPARLASGLRIRLRYAAATALCSPLQSGTMCTAYKPLRRLRGM